MAPKELTCQCRSQGRSWVREDPLEKEMATYPCILAWDEEPGGLQSIESQRVRHELATKGRQQHALPIFVIPLLDLNG